MLRKADSSSQAFGVGRDLQHRLRAGLEQQVVNQLGISVAERIDFMWQRKDHLEVGHAEQFFLSRGEPAFTRLCLALGAVPIPTGVIGDGAMATRVAAHVLHSGLIAAAASAYCCSHQIWLRVIRQMEAAAMTSASFIRIKRRSIAEPLRRATSAVTMPLRR